MVEDLAGVFEYAEFQPGWGEGWIDGLEQAYDILRMTLEADDHIDKGMEVLSNLLAVSKEHISG